MWQVDGLAQLAKNSEITSRNFSAMASEMKTLEDSQLKFVTGGFVRPTGPIIVFFPIIGRVFKALKDESWEQLFFRRDR